MELLSPTEFGKGTLHFLQKCIDSASTGWRSSNTAPAGAEPLKYDMCEAAVAWDYAEQDFLHSYVELKNKLELYVSNRVHAGLQLRMGIIIAMEGRTICDYVSHNPAADGIMDKYSVHEWTSMSKLVIATAVLILVDDGVLEVNEKISTYVPWDDSEVYVEDTSGRRRAQRPLTLVHLLTHTSGLGPIMTLSPLKQKVQSLRELVQEANKLPFHNDPGEGYKYGDDYDLIGALIEAVSGMPLITFLQARIFRPLNMIHTGISQSIEPLALVRMTPKYLTFAKGVAQRIPFWHDAQGPFLSPSGGLIGTSSDFMRLLNGLCSCKLFRKSTLDMALQNHLPETMKYFKGPDDVQYHAHSLLCPTLEDGLICWNGYFGHTAFADTNSKLTGMIYCSEGTFFNENGVRAFLASKYHVLRLLGIYKGGLGLP